MTNFDTAGGDQVFSSNTAGCSIMFFVRYGIEIGEPVDNRLQITVIVNLTCIEAAADPVLVAEHLLSPVSARMTNSWDISPPMGPVSASMGMAVSPSRWNVSR